MESLRKVANAKRVVLNKANKTASDLDTTVSFTDRLKRRGESGGGGAGRRPVEGSRVCGASCWRAAQPERDAHWLQRLRQERIASSCEQEETLLRILDQTNLHWPNFQGTRT